MWTGGPHRAGNEICLAMPTAGTRSRDRRMAGLLAGWVEQRSTVLSDDGCQSGNDSEGGERGVSLRLAVRTGQPAPPAICRERQGTESDRNRTRTEPIPA